MNNHKNLSFHIVGVSPILQHNGRLSDPLDPFNKELKRLTSKKKKTDDDHAAMAKAEWYGGIYHTGGITIDSGKFASDADARIMLPGTMIEATLINAAKKVKNGANFKAGIFCDGDFELTYDGPKNIDELFTSGKFIHRCSVRVQANRVMRTRAIFRNWELKFNVNYAPDMIDESELVDAVETAGAVVGLADYRPRFGRFVIKA